MHKTGSPQRHQANRRNALMSTGPKSAAGKRRSSGNSVSHGLSAPLAPDTFDPLVNTLTELIAQEVFHPREARELAMKILDYERNLAHQTLVFAGDEINGQISQLPLSAEPDRGIRQLFGKEIDLLDDYLDWERFNNRPISRRDQKFIVSQKLKMQKIWLRMSTRDQKSNMRGEVNFLRYLKRSSNQLIKSLKALAVRGVTA